MPLFEYECLACRSQFELLIRGGAQPVCPACGASTVEKQLSMFAVSSEGTQLRSRQRLGARQRDQAHRNQAEREFYKTDHHDD
jgi:putative FmdB family regulatory protein